MTPQTPNVRLTAERLREIEKLAPGPRAHEQSPARRAVADLLAERESLLGLLQRVGSDLAKRNGELADARRDIDALRAHFAAQAATIAAAPDAPGVGVSAMASFCAGGCGAVVAYEDQYCPCCTSPRAGTYP